MWGACLAEAIRICLKPSAPLTTPLFQMLVTEPHYGLFHPWCPSLHTARAQKYPAKAQTFWKHEWQGNSFMVIGAQDPVLGIPVMRALRQSIRHCPDPLVFPRSGAFCARAWRGDCPGRLKGFGISLHLDYASLLVNPYAYLPDLSLWCGA
jgi:hypothetical protein